MRYISLVAATAVISLFAPVAVGHAGEVPLYGPVPPWIDAVDTQDLDKKKDPLLLFDYQAHIETARQTSYLDHMTRIGTAEQAQQSSVVSLSWLPDKGDLTVHRVQIIRGGTAIDVLAGDARFEVIRRELNLERFAVDGALTATMALPGVRIGDIIRITHSTTYADPLLSHSPGIHTALLAQPIPLAKGRARVSWSSDLKVAWQLPAGLPPPRRFASDKLTGIEVDLPLPKRPDVPGDAPARFQPPYVMQAAITADWQAISREFADLYKPDGLIVAGSPLAAEVARIRSAHSDVRGRTAAALRLVQDDVRYLATFLNNGNYQPIKPELVWRDRFGDCKAKTLLLLALLHELGIEAEAVMVSVTRPDSVAGSLPAISAFDHVVVRVTHGGEHWWLDGTISGTRADDFGDVPGFRSGLPIRAAGAPLEQLPHRRPRQPTVVTTLEIDKRAGLSMPAPFTWTSVVRGERAAAMRQFQNMLSDEQVRQMAQRGIYDATGGGQVVSATLSFDDAQGSSTMTARGLANQQWPATNRRRQLDISGLPAITIAEERTKPSDKAIPVAIADAPWTRVITRTLLPEGQFELIGEAAEPTTLFGRSLARSVVLAKGAVTITDDIVPVQHELPGEQASAENSRFEKLSAAPPVVRAPASYRGASSDPGMRNAALLKPIEALYREALTNEEPALSYVNLAVFFAGVQRFDDAAAAYAEAIALDGSAANRIALIHLEFRRGRYEQARELAKALLADEPDNQDALRWAAVTTGKLGDYDEAYALSRQRTRKPDDTLILLTEAEMLALAGKDDAARTLLTDSITAKPTDASAYNNACWVAGLTNRWLDDALGWCNRAVELAGETGYILDSRSLIHIRKSDYAAAVADLNTAEAMGDQVSPDILFKRGVARLKQGDRGGQADIDSAARITPGIGRYYASYGISP